MALTTSANEVREAIDFQTEHEFNKWMVSATPEIDREIARSGGSGVKPDVDAVVEMVSALTIDDQIKVSDALFRAA